MNTVVVTMLVNNTISFIIHFGAVIGYSTYPEKRSRGQYELRVNPSLDRCGQGGSVSVTR